MNQANRDPVTFPSDLSFIGVFFRVMLFHLFRYDTVHCSM